MHPPNVFNKRSLSLILILALTLSPIAMAATTTETQSSGVQLKTTVEYTNYVHNFVGPSGNCTYVEKPMFPVQINPNQIPIGQNWTIICPLQAGHNYHIYFYGSYINVSSVAKTDYDVYVYDPQMRLESTHTQSAGLPEHLGTNVTSPLFTPTLSGNWTFVINNNPVDSHSAQEATFTVIENLNGNQWYTTHIESPNGNASTFYSNWAYEFETNASKVELYIKVANTLDMYEARLYLMNNAASPTLDGYPLPWEAGLYGNLTGNVGDYNFEPNSYRGVAYASCEYMGQPMFLNYTSTNKCANLYHLVFMGEIGAGNITFLLKTNFANATLTPVTVPTRVCPGNATQIAYASANDTLTSAQLSYTVNNWNSSRSVEMQVNNETCNGTIPAQAMGALVQYRINATDILENSLKASGDYTVKAAPMLNITVAKDKVPFAQKVAVQGTLNPSVNGTVVFIRFVSVDSVKTLNCTVKSDGAFAVSWKPTASGNWTVSASSTETPKTWEAYSQDVQVTVAPPPLYVKYSLYLIIGFVSLLSVGGVAYFLTSRRS